MRKFLLSTCCECSLFNASLKVLFLVNESLYDSVHGHYVYSKFPILVLMH